MSRIADALKKARREQGARFGMHRDADEGLRPIAEVSVPWSLSGPTPVAPPSPLRPPADVRVPAVDRRPVAVPRPVGPGAAVPAAGSEATYDPKAIERLVQNLFLATQGSPSADRRVLFTTVDESNGSATIAPFVAEALAARVNASVCLADLDLRSPTLYRRYHLDAALTLSEALDNPGPLRGCTQRVPAIANLWLMTGSKPAVDGQASVLHDAEAQRRLRELLATFDYVVAFTGAMGIHADATLLGHLLDGVVLLVDATVTKPDDVRAAADVLRRAKVRLIGTVVNNNPRDL